MRYVVLATVVVSVSVSVPVLSKAQVAKPVPRNQQRVRSFPDARKVEALISDYLENLPDREETDLISRDEIMPLFEELEDIGWDVNDQKELSERLLEDSDWLVRTLRTRTGTKFMRKIAKFPGGYAQLDLLRQSSQGKKEVAGIIRTPGGEELIQFLTNSPVGRNTSKKLAAQHRSQSKQVAQRLYTKADIYRQFKVSYAAEAESRAEAAAILARKTKVKGKSKSSTMPKPPEPELTVSEEPGEE